MDGKNLYIDSWPTEIQQSRLAKQLLGPSVLGGVPTGAISRPEQVPTQKIQKTSPNFMYTYAFHKFHLLEEVLG